MRITLKNLPSAHDWKKKKVRAQIKKKCSNKEKFSFQNAVKM